MARLRTVFVLGVLVFASAVETPRVFTQGPLTVGGFTLVSEKRITLTISEFTYRATLTNAGAALDGASATGVSLVPATTIVDGALGFGPIAAGGSAPSIDTFSFRHDRTVPFNWANVKWTGVGRASNRPPVANAGPDQTVAGVGVPVTLNGSGSSDPDGSSLTYHWTLTVPLGSTATLSSASAVSPTFTPDRKGSYTALLTVNDGSLSSAADSVTITVANTPPVANAGADFTRLVSQVATLSGAATDTDNDPLLLTWSFVLKPAGSGAVLSDPASPSPTFVVDRPGTYRLQLVASDGIAVSAADTVEVTTVNSRPVANAGPDQTTRVGSLVTLDGTGSSDVDGDPLTFAWTLTSRPAGSVAVLSNPTGVKPTFTADVDGDYLASLTVFDGALSSVADSVTISTTNSAPVANAGPDQSVKVGRTVTLDGSASSDVDGNPLTFFWTLTDKPAGSTAVLSSSTAVKPTFVPDRLGTYRVQLIVNDGLASSAPDVVEITAGNIAPVANAGPDQTVKVGAPVTLDGSGSTDADGDPLTYAWSLTTRPAGSTAVLANPTSVTPAFTADRLGTYIAQLIVHDGVSASVADTVTISSENAAPVAAAGPDQSVVAGQVVDLNGSGSSDSDGDPLTYAWSITSKPAGSGAILQNPTSVTPSFTADRPGTYIAQLIVNDGIVNSQPDTVMITTGNTTPVAHAGPDQIGVLVGAVITLDGTQSSDADGQPLTYAWSLTRPAGSVAVLSAPTSPTPTFTPDRPGDYIAQLIVNDGFVNSAADTVLIRTDALPLAKAGPDQTVDIAATVTLDGTGSQDPEGTALTFGWSFASKPAGSTAVLLNPTTASPTFVADRAGAFIVELTVTDGAGSTAVDSVTVTVRSPLPVVSIAATDATAAEAGTDPGEFTVSRTGATGSPLAVSFTRAGTATRIADYTGAGPDSAEVTIPTGQASVKVPFTPLNDGIIEGDETVVLTLSASANYTIGISNSASATIKDNVQRVTIEAVDASASEIGPDTGQFRITRAGDTSAAVTVNLSRGGSATVNADYSGFNLAAQINAGATSTTVNVTPLADGLVEGDETVVLTLQPGAYQVGAPSSATVTIHDGTAACSGETGVLVNGSMHCGDISAAGEVDTWTFTANAGDRIAVEIGEILDRNDFRPRIRLLSPAAGSLGDSSGTDATVIDGVSAPLTGTYTVLVSSFDSGFDGSGTYRLTMTHTPGPITVSAGDQGGALTNGALHTGEILQGDLDVWTFTATAGQRLAVHAGEVTDTDDFRPWIRVWAPNGAILASESGLAAAAAGDLIAPVTGTYLVLVGSFDSGFDGTGTYRLTLTATPGPVTVSAGDQGGPLTNGALHTGELLRGDLDVWTFTAAAGDRIGVHIGEIVDSDDFRPWIRIWAPNGATLGSASGTDASELDVQALVAGTYLVLVGSFDSGFDGAGTYRLTMTHTPGPITVSAGDQGGALTNGGLHTGEILQGDLDVWTFTATAGQRLAVHAGEMTETDDFRPWIRVWAPNGSVLASESGLAAAAAGDLIAPVTGTYLVLVGSFDSGFDGTGTYRLTLTATPGPITVSTGDQGGPLTNGALHTGELLRGDLDVWTFTAAAGDRIGVHIGEIADSDDFRPWIRIWAPDGATLGSAAGTDASELDVQALVAGTYLVLVGSFDSGFDGAGTYRLTMTHTPGPITVSAGDQGGALTNGGLHTGEILQGDLDVWTFTATAGQRLAVHAGEMTETDDFRPWIRVWAPNGSVLASESGLAAAAAGDLIAPVTGRYLVLVGSFDSGFDGTGTYRLTLTATPGPITVSAGDQGGPLTNGALHTGELLRGDLDVWTFTAAAGDRIGVHIGEIADSDDFRPWIRIWAPDGATLGSAAGTDASELDVQALVAGTYLVLVGSFDSGFDGAGTYRLTMTHTPGPITVSAGDQGGALVTNVAQAGAITQGDLDVWTFTAVAGQTISVTVAETSETDDFRPWVRVWAPNGAVLGSSAGVTTASVNGVVAPVTGTYLVLVGSFDSGFDGTGTYNVTKLAP